MGWKHLFSLCFSRQNGHILDYNTEVRFVSARVAGDLPQSAGCCTGDGFFCLGTFTEAKKCFIALGLVMGLRKRVHQQTTRCVPEEPREPSSSLAPSVPTQQFCGAAPALALPSRREESSVWCVGESPTHLAGRVGCPDGLGVRSRLSLQE